MATKSGKKTGGRVKGTPNKKTQILQDFLDNANCKPEQVLADICNGKTFTIMGDALEPTIDQRAAAAKELMQYIHAKRKAVEHTTLDDDGDVTGLKVVFVKDGS